VFICHADSSCNLFDKILHQIDALKDRPGLGRPGRVQGTRELAIAGPPYTVAYLVEDERIVILWVLHAARKWPEKF
jgi:toxin ParE1/3/4